MRIAYFSTEYPPLIYGGLGVYVDNISRNLASLGQKISVFSWGLDTLPRHEKFRWCGGIPGISSAHERRHGDLSFTRDSGLGRGPQVSCLISSATTSSLWQISCEREPFHLVVAHDWLGLPGGMAARSIGIPLIYHVHGLETGRSERPNPQLVALERKGADVADLVITVSEAMKREVVSLGVPAEKVRVCYHGVDTEFFDPKRVDPGAVETLRKKYGYAKDDIIVLFVGTTGAG